MLNWMLAVIVPVFTAVLLLVKSLGARILSGALRARKYGTWVMGTVVEVKTILNLGMQSAQQISYKLIFELAGSTCHIPDGSTAVS
jgi:hypothetical protein